MDLSALQLRDLLEQLGTGSPTPGGGSASALAGAIGASLVGMVAGLTSGRAKYIDCSNEMEKLVRSSKVLRLRFLDLMQEDTLAYSIFMEALKLPCETMEEKNIRSFMKQKALKKAVEVPMKILRETKNLALSAQAVLERGNTNASADAASAVEFARSASSTAINNIKENLSKIEDRDFVKETAEEMDDIAGEIKNIFCRTTKLIEIRFSGNDHT